MSEIVLFFPRSERNDSMVLPSSVLMVAGSLIGFGYRVRIIDQRVDANWRKSLLSALHEKPLVFGVSALTGKQILNGLEASRLVKENSDVPVVWGGVHSSLLPHQTLENKYIDFIVVGEGEESFAELIKAIEERLLLENIKGIGYKKDGKILINPQRDFIDLNKSAKIPYHLIDVEKYISKKSFATGKTGRDIALNTSRGCPHRCGFCYNQEFNKKRWRGMSAERVINDIIDLVKRYQISSLSIEDDEFFVDMERARKICELIIENKLDIEIFTSCRVNYVANMSDDYLNLLYRSGFRALSFGVESGSERILNIIHKDITIGQVFETIKKLKKAGINSKYYFMAGFPTETIDDLYKTTDLIYKMKELDPQIRIPAWRIFTPYPGTDLHGLAMREGWQPPETLEGWANYDFCTVKMPWVDSKKKKIIKNVAFLIDYLEMQNTEGNGLFFKLAKIFSRLVNWRWKRYLFLFVPEKYFIFWLLKIKKSIHD